MAKIPYDVFEKLTLMWEDIDYANEVAFPRALQRACGKGEGEGAEGREVYAALAVGKTKNEVLLQTVSEIRSDRRSDKSKKPRAARSSHVLFFLFPFAFCRSASKFCK